MRSDHSRSAGESLDGTPVVRFAGAQEWDSWLARHHTSSPGLFLKIAKRGSETGSIGYAEAVEIALCYGWIDAQKRSYDDRHWLQRFTPRKPRSIWSKVNRQKALELVEQGRMTPAGLAAIEEAKRSGQWERAYDSPAAAGVPPDLQAELDRNPEARAFFAKLNGTNRYAILHRLQTAKKPETRAKRLAEFVRMLANHETIHRQ